MKYLRFSNISIHINFYQNRFINECFRKNFLKFAERRKDGKTERRKDVKTERRSFFVSCRRTYVLNNRSTQTKIVLKFNYITFIVTKL